MAERAPFHGLDAQPDELERIHGRGAGIGQPRLLDEQLPLAQLRGTIAIVESMEPHEQPHVRRPDGRELEPALLAVAAPPRELLHVVELERRERAALERHLATETVRAPDAADRDEGQSAISRVALRWTRAAAAPSASRNERAVRPCLPITCPRSSPWTCSSSTVSS